MKRPHNNRSILLPATVLASLILAGCGGGGGGGGSTPIVSSLTISGTTYKSDGVTPMGNLILVFDGTSPTTRSNATGQFTMSIFHPVTLGNHTLVVEQTSGFAAAPIKTQAIQVTSSTETGVNITIPYTIPPAPPTVPPSIRHT